MQMDEKVAALTRADADTARSARPCAAGGVRPSTMEARSHCQLAIRALAAAALWACAARSAHAQAGGGGRLEGKLTDSVHARPLAGVRVQALGVDSPTTMRGAAVSGKDGAFRIDSLAPGRYLVGFDSPLLDSLEVALPPRAVTVEAGRSATLDLAMPPAVKLRAAVCPGVALAEGTGVVYGHVVSAETESPLPGAVLALQWRELALYDSSDHKTLRGVHSERMASVTIDGGGWYRACGVPTGAWISMQLQHEGRVGPVLRTHVDDTLGIAIRHLSFSPTAARDSGDFVDSAATAPLTGTATLAGVVRAPAGTPVAGAEVRVRGARSVGVTDAQGSYTMRALPAGTHELEVRRIGYALAVSWIELRSGATRTRDVQLQRIVHLDSVRVVAMRSRYPAFQQRRDKGVGGFFLGPEDIARQGVLYPSEILAKYGFRIVGNGAAAVVTSTRGRGAAGPCEVNIVIDGSENRMINELTAADVGAIEVYRGGATTPLWYDRGCGSILLWTKR